MFRVKATVTVTGEWFIPVDDRVQTPDDAIAELTRAGLIEEEPENIIEPYKAWILPSEVWMTDEHGERIQDADATENGDAT